MLNDRDRFLLAKTARYNLTAQMVKDISWLYRNGAGERQPFTSLQNAQRRLKQLTDAGFLRYQELRYFNNTFFYRLTRKAARAVFPPDQYDQVKTSKALFAPCRVSNESHTVSISRLMVKLELDAGAAGIDLPLFVRDGHFEYWFKEEGRRRVLRPDGSFILVLDGTPKLFFLEMDMGEEPTRVFARKIERYLRFHEEYPSVSMRPFLLSGFRVLVVCRGEGRGQNLLALATKAGKRKGAFHVLTMDRILNRDEDGSQTYAETNILVDPVWTRPQGRTALYGPLGSSEQTVYNTQASSF